MGASKVERTVEVRVGVTEEGAEDLGYMVGTKLAGFPALLAEYLAARRARKAGDWQERVEALAETREGAE